MSLKEQFEMAKNLLNFLMDSKEISLLTYAQPLITKGSLLQSASFYEYQLMELLRQFAAKANDEKLSEFVRRFMVERQFSKLINDNSSSINPFISLFGERFKKNFSEDIKKNEDLQRGSKAFMEIVSIRSKMIHGNLATYNLEKTLEEVYTLHEKANLFLDYLREKLLC